eukprot:TRINITY_DN5765_c0_g3_i1.p1 TRINITY_DN5765_c0_g3~~TRINITY_DN5765_c0_g3_i1.p1  ORF type:complete len:452 (+),score=67.27 TRINITY_DN5765_c0_g3_i1:23-1357(+)
MKRLVNKLEEKIGVDIDGDGKIGKHGQPQGHAQQPAPAHGGYSAPHAQPAQPAYYGQPAQPAYYGQPAQPAYSQPPQGYGGYGAAPAAPAHGGGYPMPPQQQGGYTMPPAAGAGRRKSLLIGINYFGQQGELRGCVNDVQTMRNLIVRHGFNNDPSSQLVLVDDPSWRTQPPTHQNMMQGFRWLVQGSRPGDRLFFHYSGHGGSMPDDNGDEADGLDETLIPVDYRTAGQIRDDAILQNLVLPLPAGVVLTVVLDCCHSGTALDLPFVFKATPSNMARIFQNGQLNVAAIPQMLMSQKWDFKDKKRLKQQAIQFGMQFGQQALGELFHKPGHGQQGGGGGGAGFQSDNKINVNADVVMFSGCADSQTSADVSNVAQFGLPAGSGPGGAGGACTNALAGILARTPRLSYIELLEQMRISLQQKGFKQVPQLSSSKPLNLASQFEL